MTDQTEQVLAIGLLLLSFWLIPRPERTIATTTSQQTDLLPQKFDFSSELLCGVGSGDGGIVGGDGVRTFGQTCPLIQGNDRTDIAVMDAIEVKAETIVQPSLSAIQIDQLFDRAWANGTRTYSGLIEYVRVITGKGTSKTRVRTWKEKRGLLDE
jgi:hypothetical protein